MHGDPQMKDSELGRETRWLYPALSLWYSCSGGKFCIVLRKKKHPEHKTGFRSNLNFTPRSREDKGTVLENPVSNKKAWIILHSHITTSWSNNPWLETRGEVKKAEAPGTIVPIVQVHCDIGMIPYFLYMKRTKHAKKTNPSFLNTLSSFCNSSSLLPTVINTWKGSRVSPLNSQQQFYSWTEIMIPDHQPINFKETIHVMQGRCWGFKSRLKMDTA